MAEDCVTAVRKQKHDSLQKEKGEIHGYFSNGYLGQFRVIVPRTKTVAVRQVKQSKDYDSKTDGFDDFISLVLQFGK